MPQYPVVAAGVLQNLRVVRQNLLDDPGYLDHVSCPYSEDVKRTLKTWFSASKGTAGEGVDAEGMLADLDDPETWDDVAKKARQLYAQLEKLENDVARSADVGERLAIVKAKAGLLERLIASGDKAIGLKENATVKRTLLGVIEEVMTPDQRTLLMRRLEEVA